MAMIELQDLQAPLRSKTNIVSMVLAIALFAAFRISGGGLGFGASRGASRAPAAGFVAEQQTSPSLLTWGDEDTVEKRGTGSDTSTPDDSSTLEPLDDGFDPLEGTQKEADSEDDSEDEEDGGFVDIERELGLR